uniref:Uncharacterized protein n=1 Tax=Candidatus Kentrum sp. LFY TaxID=2126342 RepID=A0A450U613_9GAMM|nr:MAG: hypothetical protein BECKLFY1418B_GA0070995_100460 [Candidatus Kentron sp. LFY]
MYIMERMKKMFLGLFLFLLILFAGCSGEQTIQAYNVLGKAHHLDLTKEGYIIGIEKYKREHIGNPKNGYPDRYKYKELPNLSNNNYEYIKEQNSEFIKATDDGKSMVVTHIASYFPAVQFPPKDSVSQEKQRMYFGRTNEQLYREYIYNAYSHNLKGVKDYERGYTALSGLMDDIENRINFAYDQNSPYSHIFIMSMGWNNDQLESIRRYNAIMNNIFELEKTRNAAFRPMIIGITWPSAWFTIEDFWLKKKLIGHLGSYTNKSNDADEIGYTIANWLINHQLPTVRKEIEEGIGKDDFPKIIAVGHSMGARLLSRAIFSRDHLKVSPINSTSPVDMFIGLQGAFSARRFVAKDSGEGAPYKDYTYLSTRIILTSSEKDIANSSALWSKHVGGGTGLEYMKKNPEVFKVFSWSSGLNRGILDHDNKDKVIILDATEIVDNHNDILDLDMAKLIMFCLSWLD